MPTSAGLLMYRVRDGVLELLLAHPGGPFYARKDDGVWTIPKGMPDDDDDDEPEGLLECARREFREETGVDPGPGPFLPLGRVRQKGGKTVHAWAVEGDCDPAAVVSNTFQMQWPPKSGIWTTIPEIDRAAFFTADQALRKINPAQAAFITHLREALAKQEPPPEGGGS